MTLEDDLQTDRVALVRSAMASHPEMVRSHARQRMVSILLSPIWISLSVLALRFHFRFRIAQAESDAVAEVRAMTTDIALAAARTVLAGSVTGAKADELVEAAIKEIPDKLN